MRQLDAFKKIKGKWKLVQQHISLPIDPETMQAQYNAPVVPRRVLWSNHPMEKPSTTPQNAIKEIRQFMDVGGASVGLDMLMTYYGPGDDILLYDGLLFPARRLRTGRGLGASASDDRTMTVFPAHPAIR